MVPNFEPKNDLKRPNLHFWVVFRSKRPVSTIFPPYIMPNRAYERIKQISDTLPLCEEWLAPETLILRKYADTQVFSRKNFYAHFPGWHLWHFYGCFRMSDCVFQRTLSGEYIQEMLSANCILLRQFKSNWCLWHSPSSPKLVKRGDDGHDEDGCFEGGKLKALASWWW